MLYTKDKFETHPDFNVNEDGFVTALECDYSGWAPNKKANAILLELIFMVTYITFDTYDEGYYAWLGLSKYENL